jgi:hypothetical protein
MKLLIGSLMVFLSTLVAAALVALFEPTGGQYWASNVDELFTRTAHAQGPR